MLRLDFYSTGLGLCTTFFRGSEIITFAGSTFGVSLPSTWGEVSRMGREEQYVHNIFLLDIGRNDGIYFFWFLEQRHVWTFSYAKHRTHQYAPHQLFKFSRIFVSRIFFGKNIPINLAKHKRMPYVFDYMRRRWWDLSHCARIKARSKSWRRQGTWIRQDGFWGKFLIMIFSSFNLLFVISTKG